MNNDTSRADMFIDKMQGEVHYIAEWRKWAVRDGAVWKLQDDDYVMDILSDTIQGWTQKLTEAGIGTDVLKHLCNYHGLSSTFKRLKARRAIRCRPEEFDANPWAVNTPEGLQLLRDDSPYWHCDKYMRCTSALEGDGTLTYWPRVLKTVTKDDKDLECYLQKAAGYSLSGSTQEQCFFILYGNGRNGKSTFLNVLKHVFNTYAYQATSDLLSHQPSGTVRTDLADLKGQRLVIVSELEKKKRLNTALIKQITGGDSITARYLYQEHFTFTPQCKLWITTNHKPVMHDVGEALWRRLKLIPFTAVIPKEETDVNIEAKLRGESRGIFNWLLKGYEMWEKEGLEDIECVSTATKTYQQENDTVALFINEELQPEDNACIRTRDMYNVYRSWCNAVNMPPLEYTIFGKALTAHGVEACKTNGYMSRVGYQFVEASRP